MTDEELIKGYNNNFWYLSGEGKATRKAKRILKRTYPEVTCNVGRGEYSIKGKKYYLKDEEVVSEGALVGEDFYENL